MRILECVAISFSRGSSHLPNPGIEAGSPALQADALTSEPPGKTRKVGGGGAERPPSLSRHQAYITSSSFCVEQESF